MLQIIISVDISLPQSSLYLIGTIYKLQIIIIENVKDLPTANILPVGNPVPKNT